MRESASERAGRFREIVCVGGVVRSDRVGTVSAAIPVLDQRWVFGVFPEEEAPENSVF